MKYKIEQNDDVTILHLTGRLLSRDRSEFDHIIAELNKTSNKTINIELKKLSYLDSIGLGLLVTIRDEAAESGKITKLSNPGGDVAELLKLACFDRLFEISN